MLNDEIKKAEIKADELLGKAQTSNKTVYIVLAVLVFAVIGLVSFLF